jgi:16S rRNA (uracil1498-N3)-methyltransferase
LLLETQSQPSLASLPGPAPDTAWLLLGPAGGWEPSEAERIQRAGFVPVSLGPRILRAETAAIAAVTLVQALWGDLR